MIPTWVWILILTLILYIVSFKKDKDKTIKAIKDSVKTALRGIPLFFFAILFCSELSIVISGESISNNFGVNSNGVFFATLLGFLLPGPRYAIYPLAQLFLREGASYGSVVSMISSQQLIDVPEGMFIEIKYLRMRFFSIRLINATIISLLAGWITNFLVYFIIPLF
ncbi:MAG: permease [Promethearchaeota archaeon]